MNEVFPRTAELSSGTLRAVGGVPVRQLVAEHGSPLYVLDRAELVGRMRAYRQAFGADVIVTYAAKALCVTGVLQLAAAEGLHVDVASAGELHTAALAEVPMERVVLHGSNKSVAELELAARLDVGRVVVDSFVELERLAAVAAHTRHGFAVLLRITPGIDAHTHEFIRTGNDDTKFGFTLSSGVAHEAVSRALATPGVALRGVHCHLGSQIFETEPYDEAAMLLMGLRADVAVRHDVVLDELNLGGGLGIAYAPGETPPVLADYARAVRAAVAREAARHGLPSPRLAVEPGRSIAGPAGLTLYEVGTVKEVPGVRTYVSVDGGMSDNLRPALYGAVYTFAAAGDRPIGGAPRQVTVVGKHCESGDILGRDVTLPADLRPGDLLAVAGTGAYGHAMASNYNRLPRPAIVLVGDGRTDVLVRRETLDDVVGRDVPLP